jgi:hypothetical protein
MERRGLRALRPASLDRAADDCRGTVKKVTILRPGFPFSCKKWDRRNTIAFRRHLRPAPNTVCTLTDSTRSMLVSPFIWSTCSAALEQRCSTPLGSHGTGVPHSATS